MTRTKKIEARHVKTPREEGEVVLRDVSFRISMPGEEGKFKLPSVQEYATGRVRVCGNGG